MKKIKKQILECKKCDLHKTATNKVVGKGTKAPRVLIVGEGPGADEDRVGVPFVGRSGKLLDKWIDFLDIRQEVAVINTIKCRTPENRDPSRGELDSCREWLDKQIEILNPEYIITVGKIAMCEITGIDDGILKWQGQSVQVDGRRVFIMGHPAYHLRRGGREWQEPLKAIKKELEEEPELRPEYIEKIRKIEEKSEESIPFEDIKEPKSQDYAPLHAHSHYSLLDGYGSLKKNIKYATEMGFKAIASTEHGSVSSFWDLKKSCEEYDIEPIYGCEFYVVDDYERDRKQKRYHLTVLAKTQEGLKNIFKLNALAHKNFFYRPRITLEDIIKFKDGLIVSTACVSGVLSKRILDNDMDGARAVLELLKEEFGSDFYIEVMPHFIDMQLATNPELIKLAKEYDVKMILTADSHYRRKSDKKGHNILKAIAYHKQANEAGFDGDGYYLMDSDDLRDRAVRCNIPEDVIKEGMRNTLKIADKCSVKFESYGSLMPKFELSGDEAEFLVLLCKEGAKKRGISLDQSPYKERFEYELNIIKEKGFINYFIIVQDIIRWAKEQDIMVGIGRGSVCGSLLAYVLGISGIDPIVHDLLFERFINPVRRDPPDIDSDFESGRRDDVIEYIKQKYGEDKVTRVVNFVKYGVKQALRDLSRVNKVPIQDVNSVAKKIPDAISLEEGMNIPEVKKFCKKYPQVGEILPELYGTIKTKSIHAGGVIISNKPIEECASIERIHQTDCLCFDKNMAEELGFLKVDCLATTVLDQLHRTLELIEETEGHKVELPIEFDDEKIYKSIFQKGLTLGVFQFSTPILTRFAKKMKVDDFESLVASTALIRPGPSRSGDSERYLRRRLGEEETIYLHQLLEPILSRTYGQIVYQEQIMQIVNQIGNLPLTDAEIVRKLVSKSKGSEALDEYKDKFVQGAIENGVEEKVAGEIWARIRESGAYLFNKSHAVAYSAISYQCAFLKTYYPKQFLVALMEFEKDEVLSRAVGELRELGFNVLYPDINESKESTMIKDNGDIIFGFGDIENVGPKSVADIIEKQPYSSFEDFMERRDTRVTNIRVIKHLIQAGAFDKFDRRDNLYYRVSPDEEPQEWDDREMTLRQLEVLDMPPETPLVDLYDCPFDVETTSVNEIDWEDVQDEIYVKGVISKVAHKMGYSLFNLTAEGGTVNILAGEEIVERFSPILEVGIPVLVKAHQVKDRERLYADFILPFENYVEYEKEIRYLNGESQKQLEYLKEQGGRGEFDLVVSAGAFTSKRGNKGCRLVFSSGERLMSFNHEGAIYAGDILQYHLSKPPFINIISRH